MSRDVLILDGVVTFVERALADVTYEPVGEPPEFNLICEADWGSLVGNQDEAAYIASMGWVEQ